MDFLDFNQWVSKEDLDKWHKVNPLNFTPPPSSTNIIFFTEGGSVFCGIYHSRRGFVCYGIGAKELTDVEVTHWRILAFPDDFQELLNKQSEEQAAQECDATKLNSNSKS